MCSLISKCIIYYLSNNFFLNFKLLNKNNFTNCNKDMDKMCLQNNKFSIGH